MPTESSTHVMIRPARAEDANAVRQLVLDAYGHYIARIGKPPGPMLDDYNQRIADGQVWVLEEDSWLAGVLVLEDAGGNAVLLDNVAVSPSAQGRGHGRALVAFAEHEARRRELAELRLYTHVTMTENLTLYTRLGFQETRRATEKGYERVYMAKQIPSLPSDEDSPELPAN